MRLSPQEALALDSVTLTAMSKDPTDRYDNADEMARDLQAISEHRMPLAAVNYADTTAFQASENTHTTVAPVAPVSPSYNRGHHQQAPAGGELQRPANDQAIHGAGAAAAAPVSAPVPTGRSEDHDPQRRHRRGSTIAWSIALIALLGVGGIIAYNMVAGETKTSPTETQVQVPDVAGRTQAEAEKLLSAAGFQVKTTEQPDAEIPRGTVISTDPVKDSSVPQGSQITLIVSSGKEITEVPDLTNMTTDRAQRALADAGLKLKSEVSEVASDSVKAGEIVSQSPGQGSQVSKGTEVAITVSTGAEQVRVPTVTGQTLDDARANLEGAGFVVQVNMVNSTETANKVLSADNEGTRQTKGSTVTLTVSKGNQFVVPDLRGLSYNDVAKTLKDAGWTGTSVQRDNVSSLDPLSIDKVVGQTPSSGSTIDKGASITVQVNVLGVPTP